MTRRALITGITGQDGILMSKLLLKQGYDVYGLIRGQNNPKADLVLREAPEVKLISGDLSDFPSLISAMEQSDPHEVYNLGALSFVGASWRQPELTSEITGLGALRVLEAVRIAGHKNTRFYQASSSEMFGKVVTPIQDEASPLYPRSPYGVAKVYAHHMVVNYRESYDMFATSGICFNHECVPSGTPVIVRRDGFVDVVDIDEIVPHRVSDVKSRPITSGGGGYEVWDGEAWVECTARTATWHDEDVFTIHARGGIVTATGDHVIFTGRGEVESSSVSTGDTVVIPGQPVVDNASSMSPEEAWLLGAIVADGYISRDGATCRVTKNSDDFRARVESAWRLVTCGSSSESLSMSGFSEASVKYVNLTGASRYATLLRDEVYCEDGSKRIPRRILNATDEIKLEFLRAYNAGDGLKAGNRKDEFKSFRTTSKVLATGLIWLARSVLGREVSLYEQPGAAGGGVSYLINLSAPGVRKFGTHLIKPKDVVTKVATSRYSGWMFDLETTSGKFSAGVGGLVVHNSPFRAPEFVTRKITMAVAKISKGLQRTIKLGNLDPRRDWGYAGDYVHAMWAMLQADEPRDYVIATGKTWSIRDLLDAAFTEIGIDDWSELVEQDPAFLRPAEVDLLCGDASKIKRELGWEPRVGFHEMIGRMVRNDLALLG